MLKNVLVMNKVVMVFFLLVLSSIYAMDDRHYDYGTVIKSESKTIESYSVIECPGVGMTIATKRLVAPDKGRISCVLTSNSCGADFRYSARDAQARFFMLRERYNKQQELAGAVKGK